MLGFCLLQHQRYYCLGSFCGGSLDVGIFPQMLGYQKCYLLYTFRRERFFFDSAQMFFRELCNRLLNISSGVEDELLPGQHIATVASELVVMSL